MAISTYFFIVFGLFFPCAKRPSSDLYKVLVRQRPSGKLRELAANRERSEINADKADAIDERCYLRLRRAVVAGIEQHAPATVRAWVSGEHFCAQMIERLDDACSGHELGDDLARNPTFEIDRLKQRRLDWVVGVDEHAAGPIRQARERRRQLGPVDGDEDDVGTRGFLAGTGLDRCAKLAD